MINIFDKNRTNDMGYALSTLSEKNKQISRNVANADTPGYRAKKLEFDEVMGAYYEEKSKYNLYETNQKHMQPPASVDDPANFVRRQNNPSTRNDGNDVNLDYEMSEQASTTILYSMLTEMVGGKFASLKEIIRTR